VIGFNYIEIHEFDRTVSLEIGCTTAFYTVFNLDLELSKNGFVFMFPVQLRIYLAEHKI